jgi:hypothetical protein
MISEDNSQQRADWSNPCLMIIEPIQYCRTVDDGERSFLSETVQFKELSVEIVSSSDFLRWISGVLPAVALVM